MISDEQRAELAYYYHPFRRSLTQLSQRRANGHYFCYVMLTRGWSFNAICATFGNWSAESAMNPNRPEYQNFPTNRSGGFGLPQWTPWGQKIGSYANTMGYEPSATDNNELAVFSIQLDYHDINATNGSSWRQTAEYPLSWDEYKVSTRDIAYLAKHYYWAYERSAAQSPGSRAELAQRWHDYLITVIDPENPIKPRPVDPDFKAGFPTWLLFKFKGRGISIK